jgi:hypothetical protein
MTDTQALQAFFSEVMTAYAEDNVPDDAAYPFLTYAPTVGGWGDPTGTIQVHIWDRTTSTATMNAHVRALRRHIGYGGRAVVCEDGWLWLKLGQPFDVGGTVDPDDPTLRRRVCNIDIDYHYTG